MQDKRKFSRINFAAKVQIGFEEKLHLGELVDISLRGALVNLSRDIKLPLGSGFNCIIQLTSCNITINFNAMLVHTENNQFGFKFTTSDIDSITHLRRLLELNSGDYDLITSELPFLVE